jgi:hypothetical protein
MSMNFSFELCNSNLTNLDVQNNIVTRLTQVHGNFQLWKVINTCACQVIFALNFQKLKKASIVNGIAPWKQLVLKSNEQENMDSYYQKLWFKWTWWHLMTFDDKVYMINEIGHSIYLELWAIFKHYISIGS